MFDDERRPYIAQRYPENFIEINPVDAERLGIESGDFIEATNDRVPVQTGGFIAREVSDAMFSGLKKSGDIKYVQATVKAVAMVMDVPRAGVAFMYFLHQDHHANALVPRVPDPITNNYRFKLGFGRIKKVGESPYNNDPSRMTFASRAII